MRSILILIAGIIICCPSSAFADKFEEAKVMQEKAMEHIKAGKFIEAAKEFEKAFEVYPSEKLLFNIAKAYEKGNDLEKAFIYYEKYITYKMYVEDLDQVAEHMKELEKALRNMKSRINISTEPEGTKITVDNPDKGSFTSPLKIWLEFGRHTITVSKEGFEEEKKEINVVQGKDLEILISLRPVAGKEPVPVVVKPAETSTAVEKPAVVEKQPEKSGKKEILETRLAVSKKSDWKKTWGWVAAGTGAAFTITGLAFYFLGVSQAKDANNFAKDPANKFDTDIDAQNKYDSDYDGAQTKATVGYVLLGAGIASAAAGTVLLLLKNDSQSSGTNTAIMPVINGRDFMAGVEGRF